MNISKYVTRVTVFFLFLFLSWQTSYCPTNIYLSNNTPFKLKIKVKVSGDMELEFGKHFEVKETIIEPWNRERVMEINRHLLPGRLLRAVNYYFETDIEAYKDGEAFDVPATLTQVITVPSVGLVSNMAYGALNGASAALEKGLVQLDWKDDGRHIDVYCDDLAGGSFHDVEYSFGYRPFFGARFDEWSNILRVLHYNVWMRPLIAFPQDGQVKRAKMIPAMISGWFKDYKPGIVEFNEVFSTKAEKKLRKRMILEGYEYSTNVIGKSCNTSQGPTKKLGNGGVILFSHWPIEEWDEIQYDDCYAEDCIAAKGALYAVIRKNGRRYHIFATHAQADTGDIEECKEAREKQFKVLRAFIDHYINMEKIKRDESIIIMGDFNVKQHDVKEYEKTMEELRAIHPENIGNPVSHEGEQAILDYIVLDRDHPQPKVAYLDVMKVRSFLPWNTGGPHFDLRFWPSDHYPVYGYFEF